jgi:uncharacterized protein
MLHRSILKTVVSIGVALTLAAGCIGPSPRSKYYLLSAMPDQAAGDTLTTVADGLSVGLGPVSFPDYLDRQQIVLRTGPNEMSFSEFDRWAEPLKNNFVRVFRENLAELLGTDRIFVYPWPSDAVFELQVSAEVIRFDTRPGDGATLDVQWMIIRNHDREVVGSRKSSFHADLKGTNYNTIVAAQSLALAAFSREVAAAVTDVFRREHGQ